MNRRALTAGVLLLLIAISIGLYNYLSAPLQKEQKNIKLLFPQHNVTYGPWSETYVFYPKTKSNAHQIRLKLAIDQKKVAYYRIFNNGKPILYAGNVQLEDFNKNDNVFDFPPDDIEPVTLVGPVTTLNNVTVIAFDKDKKEIDRDTAIFFLSINIEDYFDILDQQEGKELGLNIRPEDIEKVKIDQKTFLETKDLYDVKQQYRYVTVKDKFTGNEKEHTAVKTTILPKIPGANISLYTIIPKDIVESVNTIILQDNFTVMDPDPIMLWQFANVNQEKTLEYHIEGKIAEKKLAEIRAITLSTKEDLRKPFWYFLIPVLLIPAIMFTIIYFNKYNKGEEGKG